MEINIEARASIEAIPFSIVASVDGKEVARVKKDIAIERTVAAGHAVQPKADSTGNLAAKEVRQLASTIGNVAVGGGGRYLILHLPRLRKLAIFDIAQRKVTRYLPLAEDQIRFTAGRDKLLVFLPANNVIQRWSLETFERELSTILPINGTVKTMAMGSDSAGPMVIQESGSRSQASLIFVDIQKMARLETRWEQVRGMPMLGDIVHIRSSPDGKVFGVWSSHMPCGLGVLHTEDGKFVRTYYEHLEVVHVDPGPLGDLVFTGGGVFTAEAKPFHGDRPDGNNYIPAVKGPYYLQLPGYNRPVRPPGSESPSGPLDKAITLWLRGDSRPLVTLANLDVPVVNRQQGLIDDFTYEKRFVFLPDDKLLITLPASNDQIVINRLNVDEELEKSGVDYLLVTSSAPPIAKSGSTYNYRLVVKSKRGGVKYRLDSAPSGMTIGSDGAIVWQVPRQYAEPDNSVIVTVSDSTGQETIHSFKVRIQD